MEFLASQPVLTHKIFSQHQTSTARFRAGWKNWATPALPRSRLHVSTSTPKPRAEGSSPSAPAKKVRYPLLRHLTFSLVCGMSWQRGTAAPRAVRVEGRWSPVATVQRRPRRQPRPSPSAPATKPVKTLGFRRLSFLCVVWLCGSLWFGFLVSSPVRTRCTSLQHPKRTRFRLFLAFPGAFRCFCPLLTCKISG